MGYDERYRIGGYSFFYVSGKLLAFHQNFHSFQSAFFYAASLLFSVRSREKASELCVREYLYIDRQRYRYAVDTLSFDRFKSGFVSGLSFGKFPRKKENSTFVHSRYQERLIQQKKSNLFINSKKQKIQFFK